MNDEDYASMPMDELRAAILEAYDKSQGIKYEGNTGRRPSDKDESILASLANAALNSLKGAGEKIHRKICVDLKYCERKESAETNLILGVADCLVMAALQIVVPIILIAAYLVRNHLLDKFCNCSVPKPKVRQAA